SGASSTPGFAGRASPPAAGAAVLSIIGPALREAPDPARLLPPPRAAAPSAGVILAGAGSGRGGRGGAARGAGEAGAARRARVAGVTVLTCERGRARQMNAGARAAHGDTLLFLHADTVLPDGFEVSITRALEKPGVVAGRFDVRLDNPRWPFRMIAGLMNLR